MVSIDRGEKLARVAAPRDEAGRFGQSTNPRPHAITIQVTEKERAALMVRAGIDDVGEYIRRRAASIVPTSDADRRLMEVMGRIAADQDELFRLAPGDAGEAMVILQRLIRGVMKVRQWIEAHIASGNYGERGRIRHAVSPPTIGRTKEEAQERRTRKVRVRLSDEELALHTSSAQAAGFGLGTYLRSRAMGYPVHTRVDRQALATASKLVGLQKHWFNQTRLHPEETATFLGHLGAIHAALLRASRKEVV